MSLRKWLLDFMLVKGLVWMESHNDHCGKVGHIRTHCYKLIEHPDHWELRHDGSDKKSANVGNSGCGKQQPKDGSSRGMVSHVAQNVVVDAT